MIDVKIYQICQAAVLGYMKYSRCIIYTASCDGAATKLLSMNILLDFKIIAPALEHVVREFNTTLQFEEKKICANLKKPEEKFRKMES